ncbi:MAG: outer membrane lipoprotein carrier protein LolA, partial [Bacteroidales bacterium]
MRKILYIIFCISVSSSLWAQKSEYSPVVDLKSFEEGYTAYAQKLNSLQASMTQNKYLSFMKKPITMKGKFYYEKENHLCMDFQQPQKMTFLLDGKQILIQEDGRKDQRINANNKLFQQINGIMMDIVKGKMLHQENMDVEVLENKEFYKLKAFPTAKKIKEFYKSFELFLNKQSMDVEKIKMFEVSGDYVVLEMDNTIINKKID